MLDINTILRPKLITRPRSVIYNRSERNMTPHERAILRARSQIQERRNAEAHYTASHTLYIAPEATKNDDTRGRAASNTSNSNNDKPFTRGRHASKSRNSNNDKPFTRGRTNTHKQCNRKPCIVM